MVSVCTRRRASTLTGWPKISTSAIVDNLLQCWIVKTSLVDLCNGGIIVVSNSLIAQLLERGSSCYDLVVEVWLCEPIVLSSDNGELLVPRADSRRALCDIEDIASCRIVVACNVTDNG